MFMSKAYGSNDDAQQLKYCMNVKITKGKMKILERERRTYKENSIRFVLLRFDGKSDGGGGGFVCIFFFFLFLKNQIDW